MLDHAWALAIGCICSCYIITGIQVYKHLSNYTNSYCQNKIISKLHNNKNCLIDY